MGNSLSCTQSDKDSSAEDPKEECGMNKSEVQKPEGERMNGHVSGATMFPLQNGDVGFALREAKDLLVEARRSSRLSHEGDSNMADQMVNLVSRLEAAVSKLECLDTSGRDTQVQPQQDESSSCPFILAFDDLVSSALKPFLDISSKIGGDVAQIAGLVQGLFAEQRKFMAAAACSQKPSDQDLGKALETTGKKIQEVINYRESHRTSPFFNHLSAVSESISGLSWVAMTPTPGPFVKEMGDAAMFYTNRVLKDYKDKDKTHVDWVQIYNTIFRELQAYIKQHHTTGVAWNPRGGSLLSKLSSSPSPAAGGIPPPPPPGGIPPPPPMVALAPKSAAPADQPRDQLFAEINKGLDITSTLKKVPDDMKTHKNPTLRSGPKPFVKAEETGAPAAPLYGKPTGVQKPPRLELEGKKWYVEYQKDAKSLVIDSCRMEQCIYLFKCENTVLQVKGKANSIIIDSCKKTSVVFDDLVSACEVINCQSCQMQVMGKVPTVFIEKTDGCQVYLSPQSLNVEIVTAKSSEMNVLIPKGDGDFAECPVPEQFKTTVSGTKLQTVITEKAG